jgi:chorismate mutase
MSPARPGETPEMRRLRRRIDTLDRRLVALLSERARLGQAMGAAKLEGGRRAVRDGEREREVLLRVAAANPGPLPQAELLAIYRRIVAATRRLEEQDRKRAPEGTARGTAGPEDVPPG